MDKRIFFAGIAILAAGITVSLYLNSTVPLGKPDMTDAEQLQLYQDEAMNTSMTMLFQIVAGLGFFLLLISFGLKRKQRGGTGKPITQRPTET
jgi:heme/copper-type cytochrome/quinol oxidase subunit 2